MVTYSRDLLSHPPLHTPSSKLGTYLPPPVYHCNIFSPTMESTLSPATTLLAISKTLKTPLFPLSSSSLSRRFATSRPPPLPSSCRISSLYAQSQALTQRRLGGAEFSPSRAFASLRCLSAIFPLCHSRLACISSSAASFASAGGSDGGSFGGKGGGGGSGDGSQDGDAKKAGDVAGAGGSDVSALSPDVIILDVRGMICGGCAASVKRILESQPQVSLANVNLTTETAIVWLVSEAKAGPDWKKQLGEILAMHLTSCGFKSNLRGQGIQEGDIQL